MGRGKGFRAVLAFLGLWLAHDLLVPARYAIDAQAAILAIDTYRTHASPRLGRFVQCRFKPTCSAYGRESIRKLGFARGGWRAAVRIAKCGPWTPQGTVDLP